MERLKLYIKESYNELINKVTWPSWASLQSTSIVVVIASIILSLVVLLMDMGSNVFTGIIYGTYGG
ncbi:MAG: preprotein translocase subunit SecE [Saprospiraceae bacterium]|nr:preprotein translocase subunit SecE [Saprospiraceae bacterium]MCB9326593.1 preprotein translocase subunit SecE [Lewinellaceae bacterium]